MVLLLGEASKKQLAPIIPVAEKPHSSLRAHQPGRTTANTRDNLKERICIFAAIFER
jgi:hypothetical protein